MDEVLNETLDRIRGGSIDSGWWQSLLDRFGQQYIAPNFLRKPALQEWLAEEPAATDLKTIATWRIMASAQDEAASRDRLARSYSSRTGEAHYLAAQPIDAVAAILVASYIAAIRPEDRAFAGMLQTGISRIDQIDERLDYLSQAITSVGDPITRKTHTEHAEKELARILTLRGVNPAKSRSDIQRLQHRLDSDDLAAGDSEVKHKVRYWTARLCANDVETLDIARELQQQIKDDEPDRDLSIVDALISEMDGDSDEAIRLLRDRDDPDSRTALFGLLTRSRDASTALDEFAERMATADADFFTAVGWRNWARCMTEVGRWEEAAEGLARLDGTWSEALVLAFVEGIINSQLLLPAERRSATGEVQIFPGISPMQGELATNIHARAMACFELAQSGLREIEDSDLEQFLTDWRRWLRLMDPNDENARNARDEIRQDLNRESPDVKAVPVAWAFGVSFNPEPLRRYLSHREKLGGLNEDELRAECLLFLADMDSGTMGGREFLRYLETHQKRLARVMPDGFFNAARIDALVRDGQTGRARALLAEMRSEANDAEAMRLSAMINSHEGLDPRTELERAYQETNDIIDLRNLVEYLKQVDDKAALLPLLQDLVARHRTAANVMDLVICLSGRPFFDHRRIVELLDSDASLVEQSRDLKAAKAWALFHSGRLSDARELNDQLLNDLHASNLLDLDINLAVASGDWERLPAIVEREWPRRNEHSAETLLRLAQIAAHQDQSPNRALVLANLAAKKGSDDPHVLVGSYGLHYQQGRDEEADPNWLSRAFELSSADVGPLWSADFRTVVTKWVPERRERQIEIQEKWLGGEIPTGIAASLSNVSLTRLLIQIPEINADSTDGRMTAVIPVVFGGRPAVELKSDWTVGLDITSILVLHYLGFLESVLEVFQRVKLAPDVMLYLFQEQGRVRFHQPSRVRDGQQVRTLCNQHRLRVAEGIEAPPREIADEVGQNLAELLHAARQGGGKVVCVFPIHKPNSMMENEADTTEWDDLLVSVPDLCSLLHMRGGIDTDTHERAQLFLRSQNQVERGDPETSILDGTIYLDELALSYLQSAKVLDRIAAAALDLCIHPDVLSHMDELSKAGESGEDLAAKIDGIRHTLRSAVESGSASYLPRNVDPEDPVLNRDDQFAATRSMLAAAANCDALCVDDRFINGKGRFAVMEEAERTIPLACVLDILSSLAERDHLSPERLWTARHKLRSGGYIFIPFEVDELVHWLKATPVENDQLTEGAELRAIRQSVVQTGTMGLNNPEETFALFVEVARTCVFTIQSLWRDESLAADSAAVMSNWIWRHLVVDAPQDRGNDEKEKRGAWNRESTLRRVIAVLYPPRIESPDRRNRYAQWVDESVVQPLRHANLKLIEEALTSVFATIPDGDDAAEIFGNMFLAHLPEPSRQYLLTRYPDRTRRWGFESQTIFHLDADFAIIDQELFTAATQVLSGVETKSVQSITGNDISVELDPEDANIVLVHSGAGQNNRRKVPDLAILSPDPQVRVATLCSIIDRFGPTAPDFSHLLSNLESREPNEAELTEIFGEASSGVAAMQGALLRKVQFGRPIGTLDVLPQELAYFEHFVGPKPQTRDPEQYIRDTLIPYRRALLDRDLSRGLDICCLGALRDDLCPGQWTTHIDDDTMWDALSNCDADGAPISLLAALDVALYRQRDERFLEYATRAVIKLCDDEFGQPQDTDFYRLLWTFTRFTFNRIGLIENGSKQPGFWRRMCAWMQAQFVAFALSRAPASIDMDSLEDWAMSKMALVGAYAELVDAREEPMLLFSERLPSSDLRCEVLGRLVGLRSWHTSEGRSIPQSEAIDQAVERTQESGNWLKCFFPGPLEGHRRPVVPASEELVETLKETTPDISLPSSWHFISNASHLYALGESGLRAAQDALIRVPDYADEDEMRNNLLSLEVASIVAKTSGDTLLADAIADAVTSISTRVSNENDIWLILVVCLQASAAFEEHDAWFDWLEERLTRIASCLPGPPNRSVRIFLEHLDAMETVLPIDSWFHRRARSIASAGTMLRP